MSQPDTELDTIESIAGEMADLPVEEEQAEVGELEQGEQEEVAEQEQVEDDPEEEWQAGDQTFKVKKSELRSGYMRDADYRQKTAKVAEQRRAVEQEAEALKQQRQYAATQLDVYLGSLHKSLLGSQPDPALIDSDPQEFMRQQAAYNARANEFQQAMQHRQAIQSQEQQESQRRMAETVRQENDLLLEKVPELRDEKSRKSAMNEVSTFLQGVGYGPDELNGLVDHRALMVALKAAKYDALQAAKAKQAKPEIPRPVRPGAASSGAPNTSKQKALDRLKRNPDDLDALSSAAFD